MSSWVSLTMASILCLTLTLTFNVVTKAQEVKLIGTVYCDTCFQQYFSPSSHFISGALVAVECGEIQASGGKQRFREEVKTDVKGEFRVTLPFSATKHANEIKRCSVRLVSSSEPDCEVATISASTSSSIRLRVKTPENHVFSTGFFTFQPLEQPKRCRWESHANANDEIIAPTPLPSPFDGIGMLAPLPPLTHWNPIGRELHDLGDENSLRSSDPLHQILPPPHSIFTPEGPPPPDSTLNTGFQSPPDSMFNMGFQPPTDSMFNTGFQSPPDSMFNTGYQPPPDSMLNAGFQLPPDSMISIGYPPPPDTMLNTGFQPPQDSLINTGFQPPPPDSMFHKGLQPPPPDSMFNTGFQQPPPDSMFNTGFQPPPGDSMFNPNPLQPPSDSTADSSHPSPQSLIPQRHTPPPPPPPSLSPSLPPPPLDPQPDLIQATPPPPFSPSFPAFPFQPSAGLPRMPPRTDNPPLLYK